MKQQHLFYYLVGAFMLLLIMGAGQKAAAQQPIQWSPAQRIPDFEAGTWPPVMVADQNRTVHAFSSQWLGEGEEESVRAIMYNRWTLEQGWSTPIDILLSPFKNDARMTGAFLDDMGMIHVTFFGGDNTEAYIYYSRALAVNADRATAWSTPIPVDAAGDPELAGIIGDGRGNLAIVYSGKRDGLGLYTIYSTDGGDTWTDPTATFLTYSKDLFPVILRLSPSQSGWVNAVWDVRNSEGQGRQINYARLNLDEGQWSEPTELSAVEAGYGVLNPAVIEYSDMVFVSYNQTPKIVIRRSSDGGQTWTEPVEPFRHVGVNGIMSFATDSSDKLHLLWAQRISGNPDIHGTWHSVWQDGRWSEPEAVVSGPPVRDLEGDQAFDPFEVRAVVSQGNILLVTWRMDPGLKGNGVWYSYILLNSPELPLAPFPTPPVTPSIESVFTPTPSSPTPTSTPKPVFAFQPSDRSSAAEMAGNPMTPLLIGMIPVILLISFLIFRSSLASQNHR